MRPETIGETAGVAILEAPEGAANGSTPTRVLTFPQHAEILRWPTREFGLTERDLELVHGGVFTRADVEAAFAAGILEGQVRARIAPKPAKRRGGRR